MALIKKFRIKSYKSEEAIVELKNISLFYNKRQIINNLNSKNIKVLDLTDYFNEIDNIEQYYPLGFLGHFNSKGYKKIAEIIEKSLD